MKKQYITAFTGAEEVVEILKSIAAEDGKGLSWHIREAVTKYVDEILEEKLSVRDYTMLNLIDALREEVVDKDHLYFELRDTTATFYGMKLSPDEAKGVVNRAYSKVFGDK